MTTPAKNVSISPEEIARRRDAMAEAAWSARMEGLGTPNAESEALSELWITGQITHEEMETRRMALVMDHVREHGH